MASKIFSLFLLFSFWGTVESQFTGTYRTSVNVGIWIGDTYGPLYVDQETERVFYNSQEITNVQFNILPTGFLTIQWPDQTNVGAAQIEFKLTSSSSTYWSGTQAGPLFEGSAVNLPIAPSTTVLFSGVKVDGTPPLGFPGNPFPDPTVLSSTVAPSLADSSENDGHDHHGHHDDDDDDHHDFMKDFGSVFYVNFKSFKIKIFFDGDMDWEEVQIFLEKLGFRVTLEKKEKHSCQIKIEEAESPEKCIEKCNELLTQPSQIPYDACLLNCQPVQEDKYKITCKEDCVASTEPNCVGDCISLLKSQKVNKEKKEKTIHKLLESGGFNVTQVSDLEEKSAGQKEIVPLLLLLLFFVFF